MTEGPDVGPRTSAPRTLDLKDLRPTSEVSRSDVRGLTSAFESLEITTTWA